MFFFILQMLPFCEFYHTTPFSAQIVAKGFATIVPGRSNGTGILLHGLPLRPPRLRLGVAVWDYYQASTTTLLPQTDQPDVGGAEVDFLPVSISLLIPRIKSGMAVTNLLTVGVLILMSANHAIAQGKIPSVYYFYALWQEISCYKIAFNCTFLNE